ncbi:MAG TPA: sialidase family protein [Polyangiaceae bacterium]|nr:sialidase family protein [Polyangiaceae bacterium]
MLVASAIVQVAPLASANGRFPRAQRLIQASDAPGVMALYGTYGLLVTQDGGSSWNHICEAATGTYMGEDPLLEILPGTKIVARTETALVASQSSWCDFRSIYGNDGDSVADITRDPAQPNTIVALVGNYDKTAGFTSRLVETTDAGKTWSTPTSVPPANIGQGSSLDLAPSGSGRLYVTGLDPMGKGSIVVSDDRGQHWTAHAIAGADSSASPYLAAISSKNQDTLFVRTDAYVDMDGIDTANDSLLVSTDAGATFTTVITRGAKLFGFALSPDETTLLVGYGDPQLSATNVVASDTGLYKADLAALLADLPHGEAHFTKIFSPSVTCLRWTAQGLFACTLAGDTGFEVGRAADASFTASTPTPFAPLLLLGEVTPLPCGQGTSAYGCYTDPVNGFPGVCGMIGASCDASAPPPGTMSGLFMGASGGSGAGGVTSAAGAPTASSAGGTAPASAGGSPAAGGAPGGASGTPGSLPVAASPTGGKTGSSACGFRPARGPSSAAMVLAFLSLIAARVRRGKRRSRAAHEP